MKEKGLFHPPLTRCFCVFLNDRKCYLTGSGSRSVPPSPLPLLSVSPSHSHSHTCTHTCLRPPMAIHSPAHPVAVSCKGQQQEHLLSPQHPPPPPSAGLCGRLRVFWKSSSSLTCWPDPGARSLLASPPPPRAPLPPSRPLPTPRIIQTSCCKVPCRLPPTSLSPLGGGGKGELLEEGAVGGK